jgi:NFACT protein RNA binding domain
MVFYFKSRCGQFTIYMGKDKFENEYLIKYGLEEDVWFHVDELSSAHVYLRMKPGMTLDDIPDEVFIDCAALVKANSIIGCKLSYVHVVFTRWKNLKKTNDMVDGQVGYHRPDNVRRVRIEKHNSIVRQIEKTREERFPDLFQEQQDRLREVQLQKKEELKNALLMKKRQKEDAIRLKEELSYERIMISEKMTKNSDFKASVDTTAAEEYEDEFF